MLFAKKLLACYRKSKHPPVSAPPFPDPGGEGVVATVVTGLWVVGRVEAIGLWVVGFGACVGLPGAGGLPLPCWVNDP